MQRCQRASLFWIIRREVTQSVEDARSSSGKDSKVRRRDRRTADVTWVEITKTRNGLLCADAGQLDPKGCRGLHYKATLSLLGRGRGRWCVNGGSASNHETVISACGKAMLGSRRDAGWKYVGMQVQDAAAELLATGRWAPEAETQATAPQLAAVEECRDKATTPASRLVRLISLLRGTLWRLSRSEGALYWPMRRMCDIDVRRPPARSEGVERGRIEAWRARAWATRHPSAHYVSSPNYIPDVRTCSVIANTMTTTTAATAL